MNRSSKTLVGDGKPHERRHPLEGGGVRITTFVPFHFKKRGMGRGPVFNKFSKKVAYPLDGENGVLDFEKRHVYASTSERVPV